MSEATASREKQAAAFAAENADSNANIAEAVAALEKGMAGGFLQTNAAQPLKKRVLSKESMYENGREEVLAFCYGQRSQGFERKWVMKRQKPSKCNK